MDTNGHWCSHTQKFLKKYYINAMTYKVKKKRSSDQGFWSKEPPQMPLSSCHVGHLLLGLGPDLKHGLNSPRDSVRENYISIGKYSSIGDLLV